MATFVPLIREAEQEAEQDARQAPTEDPCERPGGVSTIVVEPTQGRVGDELRLTGGPFARAEVAVWWDGRDELIGAAEVATDCTIGTTVTIPKAEPGEHRLVVQDAFGREAEATITVTGS